MGCVSAAALMFDQVSVSVFVRFTIQCQIDIFSLDA
jgi:hypothetical protein